MNFDYKKKFELHTFFTKTISDDDVLRIRGLANTCSQDRHGDVIPIETWTDSALENYLKNPIVLAYHDHQKPIGKVVEHNITNEGLEIVVEISKAAKEIADLIRDGVLKAFSIGFYILDAEPKLNGEDGWVITQLELHEISVVSVPANQDSIFCVSKAFGTDKEGLKEFKKSFGETLKDSNTFESSSDDKAEKKFWGKKLILAAWAFEIVAAFIGLMIAWAQGFETYIAYQEQNNGVFPISKFFDIFIAALPFIMVAGVELLKIPFAYLVYINKNKAVRVVFSIVLIGVTFITFETLFTGFERQFNNTTAKVQILKNRATHVEIELVQKRNEIKYLKETNVNDIYKIYVSKREKAEKEYFSDVSVFKKRLSYIMDPNPNNVLNLRLERLAQDINQLKSDRNEEINVFKKNIIIQKNSIFITKKKKEEILESLIKKEKILQNKISMEKDRLGWFSGLSQDIEGYQSRLIFTREEISGVNKLMDEYTTHIHIIDDKLTKGVQKIRNRFREKIDPIIIKITKLEDDFERKKSSAREELVNSINKDIKKREKKYLNDLLIIDTWKIKQEENLKIKENFIRSLEAHIVSLKETINDLSNRINEAVVNTQVYRIAQSYFGRERAVDVTKDEVTFIATIWFGSLAGIVSSVGIFLAMGGFILIHHKDDERNKGGESIFSKSILLTLNALKNRIIKPKVIEKVIEREVPIEIIKEIPVDRVVIKEIVKEIPVDRVVINEIVKEVPVEKIVYKYKEVPIIKRVAKVFTRYTNNPDLLKS